MGIEYGHYHWTNYMFIQILFIEGTSEEATTHGPISAGVVRWMKGYGDRLTFPDEQAKTIARCHGYHSLMEFFISSTARVRI